MLFQDLKSGEIVRHVTDDQISDLEKDYLLATQMGEFNPIEMAAIITAQQNIVGAFPMLVARLRTRDATVRQIVKEQRDLADTIIRRVEWITTLCKLAIP